MIVRFLSMIMVVVLTLSMLTLPTAPTAPAPQEKPATVWPMLGGTSGRNPVNLTDRNIITGFDLNTGDGILWSVPTGSVSYTQPVVVGGKVWIGTNNERPRNDRDRVVMPDGSIDPIDHGVLYCFDQRTGKFLWQAIHDKLASGMVNDWPKQGIASTPTVEGNRVYYVSNRAEVMCIDANGFTDGNQGFQQEQYRDATDADIIWSYDMIKEQEVFPHNLACCSPLIVGDIVFVVTGNGVDEGHVNIPFPNAPSFLALNKHTGKLVWKDSSPGKNIMHGQWGIPSYAEIDGVKQVIFPGGDGWLYAFVPETGELIWKFDANSKSAIYELGGTGTRNDFVNVAPVVHNGRIYVGTGQDPEHTGGIATFWCLAPTRGKIGDVSATIIDGYDQNQRPINERPNPKSIAVWSYGGEDDRQWAPRDYKFGRNLSNACIVDDVVYVSELQGYLHCLDARTGQHYWQFDTKASIWGSPYYCDGKIYLGTDDGDLWIIGHSTTHEVLDEIAGTVGLQDKKAARLMIKAVRQKVSDRYSIRKMDFDSAIRSTPTIAGGVLYVNTENRLYAIGRR